MLRSEIEGAVKNLIDTIEECQLSRVFTSILESKSESNTETALDSFRKFLEITQMYNAFENQLLEMFELDRLKDTAFWASIIQQQDEGTQKNIQEILASIDLALNYLPKILILTDENGAKISSAIKEGEKEGIEYGSFSIVVIEEENLSSPKRLIMMLESIQGLYELVGHMKNLPIKNLVVTSCDSGNDKKFDFLGSAEIIKGVKDIILSLWDRVVFYREEKAGKQLELLTQSLPIVAEIYDLEKSGTLGQEEAEILRRQATSSVSKFSQAGVTIPEMEDLTIYDPRELMRPNLKSLSALSESSKPAETIEPTEPTEPAELVLRTDPIEPEEPADDLEARVDHEAPTDLDEPGDQDETAELQDFSEKKEAVDMGEHVIPEDASPLYDSTELKDVPEVERPEDPVNPPQPVMPKETNEPVDSEASTPTPSVEETESSDTPEEEKPEEDSILKRIAAVYLETNRKAKLIEDS